MDSTLENIMRLYCDNFHQALGDKDLEKYIVKNSIPIIWFGNLEKYQASPVKIVTVGLNPSWHEFLEKDGTPLKNLRFKHVYLSSSDENKLNKLYSTLNEYFQTNPYRQYFDGYEFALHYLGASYGGNMSTVKTDIVAVHIDVYSALATEILYSSCPKELFHTQLFSQFFDYLSPDIVLASIGKDHRDAWRAIGEKSFFLDKKSDLFEGQYENELEVYRSENRLIVYGRNRQRPFNIKNKEAVFEQVADALLDEMINTVKAK